MLQYLIFALVMQAVVTGVHAGLLLSQSGQESRTSLAQDQGLQISLKAPLGNTETKEVLKRRKREWILPSINIPENSRRPFPEMIVQVKSTVENVVYSLSGPGADQPPTGLFLIDKKSGEVIVTKALDREQQAKYTLTARATSEDAKEEYELIINVIDQNDNKPVFQQDTFLGSVNETTPVGYEFMTVVATDADEPGSGNSDIRYAIQSQDPPLPSDAFSINDVTGGIMLNSTSFDTKNISNYTLIILAADMEGNGLSALTKAIVTLTDSNDEGPQDDKDKTADPVVI
ncbi:cadherin-2-like isoform X2 [Engraulis encrasicolus]|uniref:cadherin-2-like isoform X2 n=1 Tax=Engraulis encrasicolus TaxID=184585 RepID=UPI002FCE9444